MTWEFIGPLIALILVILREVLKIREEKKLKGTYEEDIYDFDSALADGDADKLTDLFERMRDRAARGDPQRPPDPKDG